MTGAAGTKPNAELITAVTALPGISAEWVLHGTGSMMAREESVRDGGALSTRDPGDGLRDPDSYMDVPLFDLQASAGGGALDWDKVRVKSWRAFKREWISVELHAGGDDLALVEVAGDSMEPTLSPGDVIMVDRRESRVWTDAMYLLRVDDAVMVKRLQMLPGGKLKIISDNPGYESYVLDTKDGGVGLEVYGRVVWISKRV